MSVKQKGEDEKRPAVTSGVAPAVGIDFGTTNSALAVADASGAVALATFRVGDETVVTFRSVLYAPPPAFGRRQPAVAGPEAIRRYLEDESRGRLVQSLKSHLSSALFTRTSLYGADFTLEQLIAVILRALRAEAEAQLGPLGRRAVVGRPVRFAGDDSDEGQALAARRLLAALALAGFTDVELVPEPVGAAYRYAQRLTRPEMVLIADFGGGTSDFTVVQLGERDTNGRRPPVILATSGVAVGGDVFDGRIVRQAVAPALGAGSSYRTPFGNKLLPVPAWLFTSFERWHHLSFLRTPRTLEMLREIAATAVERTRIEALRHVIDANLGFELYRAVERAKHRLSQHEEAPLELHDPPAVLATAIARTGFDTWIEADLAALDHTVDAVLAGAGLQAPAIDHVFLTGGSSLVPAVRARFARRFGAERLEGGQELTSVAEGLALRAAQG